MVVILITPIVLMVVGIPGLGNIREDVFFPSNTWPCLIAAANYRQGTINRLGTLGKTRGIIHPWTESY